MSEAFQTLSDGLANVVVTAGPAIVRVEARRHTPGSGILWSADGLIVTANHIVRRDDNITIGLSDGQTAAATWSAATRQPTWPCCASRARPARR